MDAEVLSRRSDKPTKLAASSKFRGFGTEPLHEARKQEVKSNPVVDEMKKAWTECGIFNFITGWQKCCGRIFKRLEGIDCSSKDIEDFCVVLAQFQDEKEFSIKAGLFLSALIKYSKNTEFVIHTAHLVVPINYIGYRNTKDIVVVGNAGNTVGDEMRSGTITVKGNVRDYAGNEMKGGSIYVEGDVGERVGCLMDGGEIYIRGAYASIAVTIGDGKIFHDGEQIYPK
jgi:formylmethanofuran dehydrogenase subunit C